MLVILCLKRFINYSAYKSTHNISTVHLPEFIFISVHKLNWKPWHTSLGKIDWFLWGSLIDESYFTLTEYYRNCIVNMECIARLKSGDYLYWPYIIHILKIIYFLYAITISWSDSSKLSIKPCWTSYNVFKCSITWHHSWEIDRKIANQSSTFPKRVLFSTLLAVWRKGGQIMDVSSQSSRLFFSKFR